MDFHTELSEPEASTSRDKTNTPKNLLDEWGQPIESSERKTETGDDGKLEKTSVLGRGAMCRLASIEESLHATAADFQNCPRLQVHVSFRSTVMEWSRLTDLRIPNSVGRTSKRRTPRY